MTRTLILMRHAKSSWAGQWQSDHDRPLNDRGRRASTVLGRWLMSQNLQPDEVLCSTARRTRETLIGLGIETSPVFTTDLYHADAVQMLGVLQAAQGQCVLMIAHNPGIAEFAERILTKPPRHDRFWDYPTGATLVADFELEDWGKVRFGSGTVRDFVTPHDLSAT
jgi:phosphohistidine phosphatase